MHYYTLSICKEKKEGTCGCCPEPLYLLGYSTVPKSGGVLF